MGLFRSKQVTNRSQELGDLIDRLETLRENVKRDREGTLSVLRETSLQLADQDDMLDVMHTMWPDETRADVEAMWLGDLEADEPPPAETKPEERTS